MTTEGADLIRRVESFVYREADLADENRYAEWEQLWADDGVYWVPLLPSDDPFQETSIIFDNRRRIAIRVRQLIEGRRPTQTPVSRLRRVVSNIQLHAADEVPLPEGLDVGSCDVVATANFVGVESHDGRRNLFAGQTTYFLRSVESSFELVLKKVDLVDSDQPLRTLSFLL